MTTTLPGLLEDLLGETADLREMLDGLPDAAWETPTPAPGWTVRDQVAHLAHFDEAATMALSDRAAFAAERDRALAAGRAYADTAHRRAGRLPPGQVLTWLLTARTAMVEALGRVDATARVPWYGPDMGVLSFVTARLMETWAHGQDVADGLGVRRVPAARLRHVADIGVRALPNSFRARGRPVPTEPVSVELTGPTGESWTWGDPASANRVAGPALDFCLLVTQRRHVDDLALQVSGPVAAEWASIAQAFAGTPGAGRRAGQFA